MSDGEMTEIRLKLEPDAFERATRLAMYEIVCAMLDLTSDVQRTLELRPDACQIYVLIAVAAVQRHARAPDEVHVGLEPMPQGRIGAISRRRIADASGLPRETVARHVRHLMDRGLVVEVGRGKLTTPPGLLRDLAPTGLLDRMARRSAALANGLIRLDMLVPAHRQD